jgi:hypothetical protein
MQTLTYNNGHFMLIKTSNFRGEVTNSQPCIAAHLQGTQSQRFKPNLAKELQLPTHGNLRSDLKVFNKFYENITTLWYLRFRYLLIICIIKPLSNITNTILTLKTTCYSAP